VTKYKVYHKHNPSDFILVENDGYFIMEIKSKAIKAHARFNYSDWNKLLVRSDRN